MHKSIKNLDWPLLRDIDEWDKWNNFFIIFLASKLNSCQEHDKDLDVSTNTDIDMMPIIIDIGSME